MKISDVVESTLAHYEAARSNDRLLLIQVWEAQGFIMTPEQKAKFMELPSAETIRRVRQKIQEEGKYPANEYVRKQRKFKGMQVQQIIPKTKSEKVEEIIQHRLFNLPAAQQDRIRRFL